MPYCAKEDLLTGDIPLAGKYGDGTSFVQLAADEIDAQIGHLYVTPIVFEDPLPPAHRPAFLILKKINTLLASGRIILDMAAGGEDDRLHAYGKSMLDEALGLLLFLQSGKIDLVGAEPIDPDAAATKGPTIINEDPESLVKAFYDQFNPRHAFRSPAIEFYADPVVADA